MAAISGDPMRRHRDELSSLVEVQHSHGLGNSIRGKGRSLVLAVVFAGGSLELICRSQLYRHLSTTGTWFTNPDFDELGKSFGIPVHHLSSEPTAGAQ